MVKWRRVGGTPGHVVGAYAFGAVGAMATLGLLYVLIAGSGDLVSWTAGLFVAALTALAFRYGLIGVFVNADGVRNRSMWQTQTLAWPEIRRFETRPAAEGFQAVWVQLKDHSALRTSLTFRDRPPVRSWSVVSEETAQQALRELRAALAAAQA